MAKKVKKTAQSDIYTGFLGIAFLFVLTTAVLVLMECINTFGAENLLKFN
ncbi:hypothetical protein L21SP3_00278 [Sedimentisphaera cyanobacteriorum]|uniref:Uncharacterized protein n=1 Tax=Sedimentisphaera cyanobacteriorum TaxID=1940790 RepID=A0A1Q2HLY0_9BACT|nr:hypothetical protein [Sedimentisphaera cyanobacteriorum]AQQ08497.1 hypothetical protein L21SP3_00278 [Sedimentisphaera cyanobacteriorum]